MPHKTSELKSLVNKLSKDMKLLLVDDDDVLIEIYKSAFASKFAICDVAHDGQEAFDIWSASPQKYDLIISDLKMPVMNGLEFLEKVRERSMEQSFIVVTACTDLEVNQTIAYHQVDAILAKPLNEDMLFPLLYRVLTKIADHKDINLYINQLEHYSSEHVAYQLGIKRLINEIENTKIQDPKQIVAHLEKIISPKESPKEAVTKIEPRKTHAKVDTQLEKDLRVDIEDIRMSSLDLAEILDEYAIDKIEKLFQEMEELHTYLDSLSKNGLLTRENMHKIVQSLGEFALVLEGIGMFSIIVRAFSGLIDHLLTLEDAQLQDLENNALFLEMLRFMLNDIDSWANIVFITKEAENIYYFDASFVSNCLNISAIYSDQEYSVEDDEDMMFF